jgi:hypothetical protein
MGCTEIVDAFSLKQYCMKSKLPHLTPTTTISMGFPPVADSLAAIEHAIKHRGPCSLGDRNAFGGSRAVG